MRSECSWSLLSDRPVIFYDEHYDAHLCYWNGVGMTKTYALLIVSSGFFNMHPNDSQKMHAWNEYERVYRAGAFHTKDWDTLLEWTAPASAMHGYLQSLITKNDQYFLKNLRDKYTPQQALGWFSRDTFENEIQG